MYDEWPDLKSVMIWPFRRSACIGWQCRVDANIYYQVKRAPKWNHCIATANVSVCDAALIRSTPEWSHRRHCSTLTSNTDSEPCLPGNGIDLWPDDDLIAFTWCHRCKTLKQRLSQLQQEDSLLLRILLWSVTSQLRQAKEEPWSYI